MKLTVQSTGEVVTVQNHFISSNQYTLNAVEFADGTIWSSAALAAMILTGTAGADTMTGFASDDTMSGLGGNDTISGVGGNDTLLGGDGNDVLHGGDGNDILLGGDGQDTLYGGAGNDTLSGGTGFDILSGQAGADLFYFAALTDSVVGTNRDVITDFSHAQTDLIDVSAIDANVDIPGDQAFTFIGNAMFSAAGQLRYDSVTGIIQGSVSNALTADFEIKLNGAPSMIAEDFIL